MRTNERTILNTLNNNGKVPKSREALLALDANPSLIRYRLPGKIKTNAMKCNVLIQAELGCIAVNDFSLTQDTYRIMRVAQRIQKCLLEYLLRTETTSSPRSYETFINACVLSQCMSARMWHDTKHVLKQFTGIGPALSQALVDAGVVTFDDMLATSARRIEAIVNKNASFVDKLLKTVSSLPKLSIEFVRVACKAPQQQQLATTLVDVKCCLLNLEQLGHLGGCLGTGYRSSVMLILGDENDNLLFAHRLR